MLEVRLHGLVMIEPPTPLPPELAGCLHMRREDMVRLHDQLYRILKLEES